MFSAMAKLGHPDGEINLTKGAANSGVIQIVSRFFNALIHLRTPMPNIMKDHVLMPDLQ